MLGRRLSSINSKYFSSSEVVIKKIIKLRKTSLNPFHKGVKAKMVSFAGYEMPVIYQEGLISEHINCRTNASIFDVSFVGQIRIYGKDRFDFIESLVVGDIRELKQGSATLSLFTNLRGGIIDDTIITNLDNFLNVVVNGACKEKDLEHILNEKNSKWQNKDVTIEYIENKSLIAIQGPKAALALQNFVIGKLDNMNFMNAAFLKVPKLNEEVLVSRCGYTGEDGFEVSVSDENAIKLTELLLSQSEFSVKMAGLGARDSLRLEAGLCLYGHDINDETTPIEASLKWVIGKRRKTQGNYLGDKIIKDQIDNDSKIKRVGFMIESGPPAREGSLILMDGKEVGKVTSGTFSPILKKPIGMGYVKTEFSKNGTILKVLVRNKEYDAKISKMPFVPNRYFKIKV